MENAGEPNAAQKTPMRSSSVVWLPVGGKVVEMLPWLPAVPTKYEGGIYLPFLQLDKEEGRDGVPFEMSEKSLLFATLIHYQNVAPNLVQEIVQPYFNTVLERLTTIFQMSGMEELLLKVTGTLREDFGTDTSREALKSSMEIAPNSSPIRSDFILDSWVLLQRDDPSNWPELARDIVAAFPCIVREDVYSIAWKTSALAYIISLAILDRWTEAEAAYGRYKDDVEDPEDRQRMLWMLQNHKVSMDELLKSALLCE